MIFVDTWAWVAFARADDQYHRPAVKQHKRLKKKLSRYVTTDYVLSEVITFLYGEQTAADAKRFITGILTLVDRRVHQLVHVSPEHFQRAWQMRQKYDDKPDISFVDFTSMLVMQELGITDVFTGDDHFRQVNLGFHLVP